MNSKQIVFLLVKPKPGLAVAAVVATILLAACDPIFSIKHTMSFNGPVSNDCIVAAANAIDKNISIRKIPAKDGHREFDYYILSNDNAQISVSWYRNTPGKIEMEIFGIGTTDKERDTAACKLIRSFRESLIDVCKLDRKSVTVEENYVRASCDNN